MARVIIVGAGISGLSLAYRLRQLVSSVQISLLEQGARPGGTVWTEQRDGFAVELGPNLFLDNKPSTLALARDLGLESQLITAVEASSKNRYLFVDNRLRRLPSDFRS